ncbi:MAG: glycosyltransferase family 1 protein [Fibrobacter sp.]|uniref:glycosyltransferase family 1 protein n=1 Tax=Fibrobacter sp. TaxID=35828 RepID=UPI002A91038F|nr:glycosyltransferase family 1 protein [Fibrobacter sp.]MDY6263404.1 glycosyltransferase family 1 protein [Fibrobacter sp.]
MNENEKIRVLQVVPNMQAGGLETLIMNLYRHIDRNKVQFDFIVHYSKPNFYDEEIKKNSGRIYYLSFRDDGNILKYIRDLYKIFKENRYVIVHSHMPSLAFVHLGIAKLCGVKIRIVHSHNSSSSKTLKGRVKAVLLKLAPIFANKYFACSQSAGRFLYGKASFHVVNNAIDLKRFVFSTEKRDQIRSEFGVDSNTIVVGHIGRFNVQKNHMFLLDIFAECLKKNENMKLVLVGDGELKKSILEKISELGLKENVILTGVRKNVHFFYSIFDVFVLPSLFEGLPVTGVEAQACGVPSLFSSEITQEVNLLPTTRYLSLKESPQTWADSILEMSKKGHAQNAAEYLQKYDILRESKKLEEWYLENAKNNLSLNNGGLERV